MAADKLVDSTQLDTDLTAVANAIRTKGGTSAQLAFPAGFVNAIDAIETGGGGSSNDIDAVIDRSITNVSSEAVEFKGSYIFSSTPLVTANFPLLTKFASSGSNNFASCSQLLTFSATKLAEIYGVQQFKNCTALTTLVLPSLTKIASNSIFSGCSALTAIDYGNSAQSGNSAVFGASYIHENNTVLRTIVLRRNGVATLSNINCFNNTPFASGGSGGTLYVPSALISSYQSATNWSTILGYANNNIQAIEGSIYETQYVDGTPIT